MSEEAPAADSASATPTATPVAAPAAAPPAAAAPKSSEEFLKDNLEMPIATVNRIIKNALPTNTQVEKQVCKIACCIKIILCW